METLRQQFEVKVGEKGEKVQQKLELKQKLDRMKLIDEKITKKRKAIDELSQKIENLPADERLQKLEKKRAYLISTNNYLTEKFENINKQVDDLKLQAKDMKESLEKSIKEKQGLRDDLVRELEELKRGAGMLY